MELKFCSRCCMDGSAEELVLDENGICNFCHDAMRELDLIRNEKDKLEEIINQIKRDGEGKDYDVLIGLSGGADSSTALYQAVRLGLRPLCFSIDNGWNNPLADENIMRLVEGLKVPFIRYNIDLAEFRELQGAFLKAGQKNLEIPTDHVLMAATYEMARNYDIKWILSGGNVNTESIMPASWGYNARDLTHIKSVYKWATGRRIKNLPTCGIFKWNYHRWIRKARTLYLLDYLDYHRADSIKLLSELFGYKDYYQKHCESYYTWWFQTFYLFEKFGIDKRKAHYSSLINSGQMTRQEAMDLLADRPVYPELGLESRAFSYKPLPYDYFKTDKWYGRIAKLIRLWKSLTTSAPQ